MFKLTKNADSVNNNNPAISFNYYSTIIENVQITKDKTGDVAISATFDGKVNEPNINYMDDNTQSMFYQSKKIYVYGKIHKISGSTHDTEMVIEHIPISNGTKKLFSCFLLKKTQDVSENSISSFIKAKTNNEYISFNEYINTDNTTIVYETITSNNDPCTIIVFTNVIPINDKDNDLSSFSETESKKIFSPSLLTNVSVAKSSCLFKNKTVEGFAQTTINKKKVLTVEGGGNDIFTCEYLPVSTDTVDVFQIPIDTSLVKSVADLEFTNTAVYIFISIISTIIIFFVSPNLYNMYWLKEYKKDLPGYITNYTDIFVKKMNTLDASISATILLIFMILFIVGFSVDNNMALLSSCLILFIFIVGYFSIYINGLIRQKMGVGGNNMGLGFQPLLVESAEPSAPLMPTEPLN